jgi:indoleacetamide hydrolase
MLAPLPFGDREVFMPDEEASTGAASASEADGLTKLGVVAAAAAIRNGEVTSESYSAALLQRAAEDADIVSAIRDAGAIVFGKNNLVEMSYGLTGNNIHYGQVKKSGAAKPPARALSVSLAAASTADSSIETKEFRSEYLRAAAAQTRGGELPCCAVGL